MKDAGSKRTIPELREAILEIADYLDEFGDLEVTVAELRQIAEETKRRFGGRKARKKYPKLTHALAKKIRLYADQHPNDSYSEIATAMGVNPGRVSEAMIGFRDGTIL